MFLLSLLVIIILSSLLQINCQQPSNHTLIELKTKYNGTLETDNSLHFYKLIIPEGVEKNSSTLVFKVKEPDSALIGKDDFSDPDIYVSTVKI